MTKFNMVEDLFSQEEYEVYKSIEFPFNIPYLRFALDRELSKDPEYEVWVPLVYHRRQLSTFDKNKSQPVSTPHKVYLSNKGNVLSLRRNEPTLLAHSIGNKGYIRVHVLLSGGASLNLGVHRAMACSFIPLKKEHGGFHPKDLEVNHIDADKTNFELDNLEWCTPKENLDHAVSLGLIPTGESNEFTKPVKGTVLRGKFIGHSFLLFGRTEMGSYGFDQPAITNTIAGNYKHHLNCSFVFATPEEIESLPRGLPEDILTDIKSISSGANFKMVGTHRLTKEIVELIGERAIKEGGFNAQAIANQLAGRSSNHKGYTWEKIPL